MLVFPCGIDPKLYFSKIKCGFRFILSICWDSFSKLAPLLGKSEKHETRTKQTIGLFLSILSFCHFWVFEFFFQFQLFRKLIEVILGIWEVVSLENSMWFGFYAFFFISVDFLVKFYFSGFCLFLFGFFF